MKPLMFAISCVLLLTAVSRAHAQETESKPSAVSLTLEAPEGWSGETINLPPGFARDMTLKGVEVIRFAPGMFQPDAESFFSYALVFWLPETESLTQKQLHEELLKYYRGLATAVARGRKLGVDPGDFQLKLNPIEKQPGSFRATLDWAEPFRTGKVQALRFEVSSRKAKDQSGLLLSIAASPQPHDHKLWKQLNAILKTAKFVAATEQPTE
ncbi:MAG: hypothetical protein ACYTGL_24965 [Planctomycetota bacterium]|jgi:hypothetical protein